MSSARSSIETPAFRRRTFDWLRVSWLKGMSRDPLRTILGKAFAMGMASVTGSERLSLVFQTVTETGAAL